MNEKPPVRGTTRCNRTENSLTKEKHTKHMETENVGRQFTHRYAKYFLDAGCEYERGKGLWFFFFSSIPRPCVSILFFWRESLLLQSRVNASFVRKKKLKTISRARQNTTQNKKHGHVSLTSLVCGLASDHNTWLRQGVEKWRGVKTSAEDFNGGKPRCGHWNNKTR